MTDDIDRLLHAQGERWRATLPPPPDVATALRQGHVRVRRAQVLGAAAAVLVVAGGLAATIGLLNRGDQRTARPAGPTPSASSTGWPAGAVPWQPLAATHPTLPSTTVPASPGPADAAGVRPCTASDLRASIGPGDGAGGTLYRRVLLTLVGPDPCRLSGYPTVEPLSHGHRLDLPVEHQSSLDALFGADTPVKVAPGRPAVVTVARAVSYSCPAVDNDRLRVTLPGIATAFTVAGFGTSSCDGGRAGGAAAPLLVGPVHPLNSTPARKTSPYDGVTVAGDLNLTARAGQPLDFAVTLTSKHDLPLAPCPDYTISTSAGESSYALDCAAVPHRDAQGRPYLPAGVPVTFAMRADPGQASTPKFLWRLTTPHSALILVVGTLTVTGSTGPAESTVVGTVSSTGGPAGVADTPDLDGTITASRSDGLTRTAPVNVGTFLLSLPPGRWQLVVHSQQYDHGAPCLRDAPLDLSAARTTATSVHISCQRR